MLILLAGPRTYSLCANDLRRIESFKEVLSSETLRSVNAKTHHLCLIIHKPEPHDDR